MTAPSDPSPEPAAEPAATPDTDPTERPLNRTITPVAGSWAGVGRGRLAALTGLAAGVVVLTALGWGRERPQEAEPAAQPARQIVPFEAVKAETPPPDALVHPALAGPGPTAAFAPDAGLQIPAPERPATGPAPTSPSMLVFSKGPSRSGDLAAPTTAPISPAADAKAPTELDALRRGSAIGRVTARPIGDLDLMLLAGALAPCVLETALDSSAPGYASCLIARDVYSASGAVVLLEKGTRVLGEYRAGMRQGQRRLFVLWTRAVTPAGIAVDLASPATDPLGRAGFDGSVDTRFWDRFGGAVLLSMLDVGVTEAGRSGADRRWLREPSDTASVALEHSVDIPAVLRKRAGEEVAIFVAADLDFTSVYRLKAR